MDHIEGGFYLKARRVQQTWIAKAPPHIREIWDWILLNANYKDNGKIKRGQLLTTYGEIVEGLAWYIGYRKETYKKHHCETATKALTRQLMVTTTRTTRGIIITVLNYSKYQDVKNYESDGETCYETTRDVCESGHDKERKEEERKEEEKDICTDEQKTLADKLIKIVSLRRSLNITYQQRRKWENTIRLMMDKDKITGEKIQDALFWYEKNWMNEFVPVVESASALREKWAKVLNAIDRDKSKSKGDKHNGFDQRDYRKHATDDANIPEFLRG